MLPHEVTCVSARQAYLANNPDVDAARLDPVYHYQVLIFLFFSVKKRKEKMKRIGKNRKEKKKRKKRRKSIDIGIVREIRLAGCDTGHFVRKNKRGSACYSN